MKEKIHPSYQEVLFIDSSEGFKFICGTTLQPTAKEMYEGKEYPAFYVSVSSASHPFFTKSKQFIDTEGRVDKFTKRYAQKNQVGEKEDAKKKPAMKKVKTEKKPASKKK